MSFVVTLPLESLVVDAGPSHQFAVEVTNRGDEQETLELTVDGLDPTWYSVPSEPLALSPGQSKRETLLFRIPRESESGAGNYPFTISVRSLNSGETNSTSSVLTVNPYHQISISVNPKRVAMGSVSSPAQYTLNVLNLGNTEHSLQLFANDPEGDCIFEFEAEQFAIGPGQQRQVTMQARPRKKSLIASQKLYGVNVSTRSTTNPTIAAYTNCQLEVRPMVSPAPLAAVLALTILGGAWFMAMPRPARIELFQVDKQQVLAGEPLMINWQVANSRKTQIRIGDRVLQASSSEAGSYQFIPTEPGSYTITLVAMGSGDSRTTQSANVVVGTPEKPEITSFTVSSNSIEAGKSITVEFKVNPAVKKVTLLPNNLGFDTQEGKVSFVPNWVGEMELTLVAESKSGEKVQQVQKVEVKVPTVNQNLVKILSFGVNKTKVFGPDAKIVVDWKFQNCVKAEILWDGQLTTIDPNKGTQEIAIKSTGQLVIRGYNSEGKMIEQRRTIEWSPDEPKPNDDASPGGGTPPPPDVNPTSSPNTTTTVTPL